MKKVLVLFHGRWMRPQVGNVNGNFEFCIPNIQFTRLRSETNNSRVEILQPSLREIVRLIDEGVDAIFGGEYDAVIVQYVLKKLRKSMPPFIIEDLTLLGGVKDACSWICRYYNEDPLDGFVRSQDNFWMHYIQSQHDHYILQHIPVSRLSYVPGTSYVMNLLNPEISSHIKYGINGHAQSLMKNVLGGIFSGGVMNRDYDTLLHACEGFSGTVHVVTDKRNYDELCQFPVTVNVKLHAYFPLAMFIEAVRHAPFVVLPLKDNPISSGHFTLSLAMRLKKAVIMTKCASAENYCLHGESGWLVEPGDPAALRESMEYLYHHPDVCKKLGENAAEHEKKLSVEAEKTFIDLLEKATCH